MATGIFAKDNQGLWTEKYRPKGLNDYIGNIDTKEQFKKFLDNKDIPHILMEGPPGTGKSSFANIVVTSIPCDFKYLNASTDNKIETVRTKIMSFCTTAGYESLKVLILDEFDRMSPEAQDSLKAIMEQYSKHTRFILTCNNVERVVDAIKSRCQDFTIVPPTKKEVIAKCKEILTAENVIFDDEEVDVIVNKTYPDIRKAINTIQKLTIDNVLKLSKEFYKILHYQKRVIEFLTTINDKNLFEKITEIRQLMTDERVKVFNDLFRYLYDNIDVYKRKDENVVPIILTLAEGQLNNAQAVDKEINMVATLIKLSEIISAK